MKLNKFSMEIQKLARIEGLKKQCMASG